MHQQRIAIAVTAVLGALCTFVPWLEDVPWRGTLNGTEVEGGLQIMGLCLVVAGGMFVGKRTGPLTPGGYGLCRLAGIGIVLCAIYLFYSFDRIGAGSHIGFGPYFLLVVGVAIAVLPNVVKGAPASQKTDQADGPR